MPKFTHRGVVFDLTELSEPSKPPILYKLDLRCERDKPIVEGWTLPSNEEMGIGNPSRLEVRLHLGDAKLVAALDSREDLIIEALDLSRSKGIKSKSNVMAELASFLRTNTTIKRLELVFTGITTKDMEALREALKENTTLEVLNLSTNEIMDHDAGLLGRLLQENPNLKVLNLSSNGAGGYSHLGEGDAIPALAAALRENSTLEELYLFNNGVEPEGIEALATALRKNTTLTRLDLKGNEIELDGAEELAEAVYVTNMAREALGIKPLELTTSDPLPELTPERQDFLKGEIDSIIASKTPNPSPAAVGSASRVAAAEASAVASAGNP